MKRLKAAKTATDSSEPTLNAEQLGGLLNTNDRKSLTDIQAGRLKRLFALSLGTASTIAALAYGVVR